jgi:ABC-type nitrate/sulfonate/bicarbonate transport system ATPase subunit
MASLSALTIDVRQKRFAGGPVLGAIHLALPPGEVCALIGPSGCGKTTLLNLVAGLDNAVDGQVTHTARRLGYVFQTPRLFPWMTAAQNIALLLPEAERADARTWLAAVGLSGHEDIYPERLSLGMARRVSFARALAVRPDLLLLDEPFVSLDDTIARALRTVLRNHLRRHPATVLLVTHDLRAAASLADRIVFLSERPARVVSEVAVHLPQAAREDDSALDHWRLRLMSGLHGVVPFAAKGA